MSDAAVIMAYANPLGGQPAGSTFVVERLDDGVALHKSLGPDWVRGAVFGFVGVVTCVVTTTMAGSALFERPRNRDPLWVLIPIVGVLAGHRWPAALARLAALSQAGCYRSCCGRAGSPFRTPCGPSRAGRGRWPG